MTGIVSVTFRPTCPQSPRGERGSTHDLQTSSESDRCVPGTGRWLWMWDGDWTFGREGDTHTPSPPWLRPPRWRLRSKWSQGRSVSECPTPVPTWPETSRIPDTSRGLRTLPVVLSTRPVHRTPVNPRRPSWWYFLRRNLSFSCH